MKIMKYSYHPNQYYQAQPAQESAKSGLLAKITILLVVFILLLLPVGILAGAYAAFHASDLIFPGVQVGQTKTGGLERDQMANRLDMEWNRQSRIVLTDGINFWQVTPGDLGLWIDPQATTERAYEVGRGQNALQEIAWLVRFGAWKIDPVVVFDPNAAKVGLERFAAQVYEPAENASLLFENGAWVVTPSKTGVQLDIVETYRGIASNPQAIIAGGYAPVMFMAVPPQVADLTPIQETLQSQLEKPLRIQAYDPITDETIEWRVPREEFAKWVTLESHGQEVTFGLDSQYLADYMEIWKASLAPSRSMEPFTPPSNLVSYWRADQPVLVLLRHNPTTYTVEPGDTLSQIAFKVGMPYWKIQQANSGIDPDSLRAGQTLTIPSRNEMLPLPIVRDKRIVLSISQQRMWVYENGSLRNEHVISTGIDRSPTVPGIYQIRSHEEEAYASVWDLYMPHFMGIYEGWPGFMNGIHGLPTLSSGQRLWAGNLGRPVSYGCIILGLEEARDLFYWAEEGVIVEIQP
jgi:lipoprotein-anchoring transpeptidase ErfK/SrfK